MLGGDRISKINEVLKEQLGPIILREVETPPNVLITINKIETTRDLNEAKIFISVFPEKELFNMLDILNKSVYNLHQILNKKIHLRKTPKLRFLQDNETEQDLRMEHILDKIKQEDS